MNAPLQALIVDDEPPARNALAVLLREVPDVAVVGMAADGLQALDVLARHPIDLLLLDIEMPVLAGLDLAMRLTPAIAPVVIFVTAYPQYAVDAFDVDAADYLLKPVEPARLAESVRRARQRLQECDNRQRIAVLEARLKAVRSPTRQTDRANLWVECAGERHRLPLDEVEWFAADGDYVQVHTAERSYLMTESLGRLQSTLPQSRFLRMHRSIIVNIGAVVRVSSMARGYLVLITRSGAELQVARRSRDNVRKALGL